MPNELGQRIDDLDSAMAEALLGGDMTAATALSNQRDEAMEEFRTRQAGSDPQTIPQSLPTRTYGLGPNNELYYTDENGDIVFPTPAATESVPFENASPFTGPMTPPNMPSSRTPPEMPPGTAAGGNNTPPGIPAAGGPGSFTPSGGNFNGSVYRNPRLGRRNVGHLTGLVSDFVGGVTGIVDRYAYEPLHRNLIKPVPVLRVFAPTSTSNLVWKPMNSAQESLVDPLTHFRPGTTLRNTYQLGANQLHGTYRGLTQNANTLFGRGNSWGERLDAGALLYGRAAGFGINPSQATRAVLYPTELGNIHLPGYGRVELPERPSAPPVNIPGYGTVHPPNARPGSTLGPGNVVQPLK